MAQQNNNLLSCPFCLELPPFINLRAHLNSTHSDKTEDELNMNGGTFKNAWAVGQFAAQIEEL